MHLAALSSGYGPTGRSSGRHDRRTTVKTGIIGTGNISAALVFAACSGGGGTGDAGSGEGGVAGTGGASTGRIATMDESYSSISGICMRMTAVPPHRIISILPIVSHL